MHPEHLDSLRRRGKVQSPALSNDADFDIIAELCTEEFAFDLFCQTARYYRLLSGRDPVRNSVQGIGRNMLRTYVKFLPHFLDRRMILTDRGVHCLAAQAHFHNRVETRPASPKGLPDPVLDDFTTVHWLHTTPHWDSFPHLVLLVKKEGPRTYSVLPLDPLFLQREDTAFEASRLFSVHSELDVCLVLSDNKCVYINKDGRYKMSSQRPTGGAVAHRSVTGHHLYKIHLDPLVEAFDEQPELFAWEDDFGDGCTGYSGSNYQPREQVAEICNETRAKVTAILSQVALEYVQMSQRKREMDPKVLKERVAALVGYLGISAEVEIVSSTDLADIAANPICAAGVLKSPLYSALDAALDVMETDFDRAGIHETVNSYLQPLYTASHIGYARLLAQSARLVAPPDNDTLWSRIVGQLFPAAVASLVTTLRLDIWKRLETQYRSFVPPANSQRASYEEACRTRECVNLMKEINKDGPIWFWQDGEKVRVMPAVVVRLDEDQELHCDDGPAIIDPDGTCVYAIHGSTRETP